MSTIRVDRITPYQSGSVAIESLSITNLSIEGTLTASIQEGHVLVGGSGNVSTLTPTSSFGGGGSSTDITALNSYTESADSRFSNLESTTSSLEGQVSSLNSFTTSQAGLNETFATTGSNVLIGTQIISGSILVSGSINSDGYELAASSTQTIPVLNTTFNLDLSGSSSTFINKSLVLGNGKVLVAGRFSSIDNHTTNDIARLNSNGSVDTSFSSPVFSTTIGGDAGGYINTFVTQSDDKIVIGGNFSRVNGISRVGIARLNVNGTLDESFVTQSFGSFGEVRDITIQNDNKILFVGSFPSGSRRVNSNGDIDTSLIVSTTPGFGDDNFYSVALLPSGSEQAILIGGDFQQWNTFSDYNHLVKLHPSGALDFGFAGTNLDIATGNSLDRIEKIKVTDAYSAGDNGYIYIAGRFKDTLSGPNVRNAGFARLTTADEGDGIGAFDSGFRTYISGSDQNLSGVSVYVNDFDFYDGNKILLGGNFITFGIPGYNTTSANRFAIVSQNTGNLISGWAASGSASTYNLNTGSVNSVTLLPNDNVLVGGTFTSASSPQTAREGLASLKLTGFGNVTTTSDYSITADSNQLLISSSNTYFSGDITASTISGSFVGDGSGLTGLPVSSIDTGSFAVTGSNTFVGNQQISGSLVVTGSIVSTTVGVYRANLLDQGSYINPTELENSTGRTFSWIASGTGFYRVTISGASIHQSKIIMRVSQTYSNNSGDLFNFVETRNPNQPEIRTRRYDASTSTFIQTSVSDGGSNYFSVEILIYP